MSTAPDTPAPVPDGGPSDALETGPAPVVQPAEGGAAPTRYKTLEEADRAARKFQSDADKWANLRAHPLLQNATPAQIREFVEKMIPVIQRPDFAAYQAGQLAPQPIDDELDLTDEQREIRELRQKLSQLEQRGNTQDQENQRHLVEARFERAEKEVAELLGPAWSERRSQVLESLQSLARNGVASHVDPMLLLKAYWNSFEDVESLFEAMTHHVSRRESSRLANQRSRETTVPGNIVPGAPPPKTPKSFAEAWAAGLADLRRAPA
jgi:hypothetical protein